MAHRLLSALACLALLGACASGAGQASPTESPTAATTDQSPDETSEAAPDEAPEETREQPAQAGEDPTAAAATCEEVRTVPVQGGEHLIGDSDPPVPYNSTPPTSGWHSSGAFDVAVQPTDEPLSEPRQVSVLEAGGVVVTHHGIDPGERARLEQHVRDRYDGRVAVTVYEELAEGEVAFTAWGVLQRCSGVDLAALDQFVATYADEEVHAGHDH